MKAADVFYCVVMAILLVLLLAALIWWFIDIIKGAKKQPEKAEDGKEGVTEKEDGPAESKTDRKADGR